MARLGKTAQEFIQDSFSPIIAVLCSPKVENVVSKNNLSFTELLQPFTAMDWKGQFRDPSGNTCTIKNWKLIIRDVNWKPLQPTDARRQLNNAVLYNYHDKTVDLEIDGRKFDIPQSTHWFDAWRETYLEVQFPSDHEFTKHFISCIIVGTTYEENVIDSFNNLNQQYAQLQNITPPKLPKWFNSGVLKSYLLLHDVSAVPKEKADASFETLKQTFGAANCFMLSINSKSTLDQNVPTDLWAQFIKRSSQPNNEMSSSLTNLPTTPAEPQPQFPAAAANLPDDSSTLISTMIPENVHPLTAPETDVYDNANSLQTHSFSGSSESVNVAGRGLEYSTEVHGIALNTNDIEAIKKFLQEYASKALLPYMEKQISQLSEVVANRKGVSRSLLSATKRWFGTGKTGNTTANSTVIYTTDCPELQLRRLGDLWFLCRQWQRAFDSYHTAKREFYADSAWLCYAGALEMAAISAFMAGEANRKTHGYMEESIVTYLNTCRMVQYAVRATLLSVLCLSASGSHGEAAKQLIRMTSEDSDLRSAMLLEQAALCFLSGPGAKGMCRKYAFHMVLAGHRFSKAGQKKHAYRCYKQAYQVYAESGWRLATDHVQFALGRLAGALRRPRSALRWLAAPLAPAPAQPPHQQAAFLREYLQAHQQWIESADEPRDHLEELPLPLVVERETSVLCVGPAPLASPRRRAATSLALGAAAPPAPPADRTWRTLEEMLLQVAQGAVPMIFKPTVDLYTDAADTEPLVPQGEPIQISITLWNPLKISLILKDVELLWRFVVASEDGTVTEIVLSNEQAVSAGQALESNIIFSQKIKSVLLEGDCKKVLIFTLTPLQVGRLNIHGLAYKLINAGEGGTENGNSLVISGKVNLGSSGKGADKRLNITVIPEAPCLQMTFSETNPDVISGEMRTVDVEFTNVGPVDMHDLYIAVSHPDCINLVTSEDENDFKMLYEDKYREPPSYPDERALRTAAWRGAAARHVRRAAARVARGGSARARLQLRPRAGASELRALAYYATGLRARPYRLLRHVFRFRVAEAVELAVTPRRSVARADDEAGEAVESMNLAVEIKNVCGERDDVSVHVLEASLLSRQWRLASLVAARGAPDPLAPRDKLHFVLRARRLLTPPPQGKIDFSRVKIASGHPDALPDIDVPPYSKFVMDGQPSYVESPDAVVALEAADDKKKGLIRSMFVLRWRVHEKSKGRSAVGQHCLWLDCFTKAISREKELAPGDVSPLQLDEYDSKLDLRDHSNKNKKDNVVIFRLEHSNHINHNFKEMKLCLVPITLNIVNCYGVPVKVFIDMSKQKNREMSGELGWAGALSYGANIEAKELGVSVNLDKFESKRVQVRGVCAAPGTYLVGSAFSISTTGEDVNLNVSNVSNNTSLLIVQQVA